VEDVHYNLIVRLLNDRYGIQVRGGCSCAGTYGHYLYNIDKKKSQQITNKIYEGDLSSKPGWVRYSIHPIMTNEEIMIFVQAMKEMTRNLEEWKKDYVYDPKTNDFFYINHIRDDLSPLFRL
jgi:selenocysteine lyase/cysteine desulfurase